MPEGIKYTVLFGAIFMRLCLLAIGLLAVLATPGFSQSRGEMELYEKLTASPQAALGLETVLKQPSVYSATILFVSSGVAFKEKRLEDSAFLFYTAQLRALFDQQCFPPKGQGGDSPLVAYGALAHEFGSAINPAVMAQPKVFEKVMVRVKKWTPKASADYDPGYEFTERKTEQEAAEAAKPNRDDFLERMSGLSTLLNDSEYFAAFRILQAYNSESNDQRPTDEANDQATETMIRIEKERKIKGVFGG